MSSLDESSQPESAAARREALKEVLTQVKGCVRCSELAAARRNVVFGAGNADAELMFVGEAPGASEDEQGLPFVGQAGKLLEKLLVEIGMTRAEVFIANVLKCLRYNAQVQLGDGSWERIGRLVRSRYAGTVMSVDAHGSLVPRRIIGWHASPLAGRRVFRLTYRSAKSAGAGRVGVELTGDHPVLTERGYVPVEELLHDDRIATGQGLSDLAFEVVCGTVLGDGHLSAKSATLSLSHSERQSEYAHYKAELLAELNPRVDSMAIAVTAGAPKSYGIVQMRTLADRSLSVLRREFYGSRKRVPTWIADRLTERMLAIWFMDDGYMRIRPGRQPSAEIASVAFSDADLQVLLRGLSRLGLSAKAYRGRIHFDVHVTETLSQKIAPYVPPSMRYKLHPEVAAGVPFDPIRLHPGPRRLLYDNIEVEDITKRERADTTFFCLDVEDTHNFVTAGGVVHNCRPPGNRDPLPVEIENCREYLYRQVELIQPKVICSLGNFSTKLLRGDPTGITRLHGQPQPLTLGRRTVRLYPIFHPAAALYTPRMLETLREDFARLPALLAMEEPEQSEALEVPELEPEEQTPSAEAGGAGAEVDQLGLF
ncbi:MAG: uracil-DNA glycosylase family protein [Solirubrobacterales bacterium]